MNREDPDDLVAALRRLGESHQPDTAGIWARVDPARERTEPDVGPPVPVSLDARRDRAVREAAPRPVRARVVVPLAAAAVLGVLVVSQVVGRPGGAAAPAATLPVSVAPDPSATTGTTAPSAVGTAVATSTRPSSTRSPRPGTSPSSPGVRPSSSSPVRPADTNGRPNTLGVQAPVLVALDTTARGLLLATPGVDDWVVVGARSDLQAQRAKRPTAPSALTVVPPGGAVVAPSPLTLGWSDGLPEQQRTGVTTWLTGPSGGTWTITSDRLDFPRRLVVVGGGASSGLRMTVAGSGRSGEWTWAPNPAGPAPFSIAVEIPGGVGPVTVTLAPLGGGALSLAAVTSTRM